MDLFSGVTALIRLIVGGACIVGSVTMMSWHLSSWRKYLEQRSGSPTPDDSDDLPSSEDRDSIAADDVSRNGDRAAYEALANEGLADSDSAEEPSGSESEANSPKSSTGSVPPAKSKSDKSSPYALDDHAVYKHHRRQVRQRTVTSALIGIVGLMVMASHYVIEPTIFAWGLFLTVLLVLVIFCSAMVDALRTQLFFQQNDQGFRNARRELVVEYQRLKQKRDRERKRANKSTDESSKSSSSENSTEKGDDH